MFFKQIETGFDRNFSYIIADGKTKEAVIIDPSRDTNKILKIIEEENLNVLFISNTHDHIDHTIGNKDIIEKTEAKIIQLKDNEIIKLGKLKIKAIYTPGHSKDHLCFLVKDKLLTGDLLFVGKIGGTGSDFPGSDSMEEFESLHKILKLPDDTEVWPGHDYGVKKSSTIGHEKKTNPFLLRKNFEDFQNLKDNWAEYKKEHNIQ